MKTKILSNNNDHKGRESRSGEQKTSGLLKLTAAMKMKYKNVFYLHNYNDADLNTDLSLLLNTTYKFKQPKDIFLTIEGEIIKKVKSRPVIKAKTLKNGKAKHDETQSETVLTNVDNISTIEKEKLETGNKRSNHHLTLTEPHALVDKLKAKRENNYMLNIINEDNQRLEKEKLDSHRNKINKQNKLADCGLKQIEDKENKKRGEKEEEMRFATIQQNEYHKWQEEEKKRKLREKEEIIAKTYAQQSSKKLEEYKGNGDTFFEKIGNHHAQYNGPDKKMLLNEGIQNKNEFENNKRKGKEEEGLRDQEYGIKYDDVMRKKELENEVMKERVYKKNKEQEAIGNYMKSLMNQGRNTNENKFIQEREEQERKKQMEFEKADGLRKEKIQEMKESLETKMKNRLKEKENIKGLNNQIKENINKNYNEYLSKIEENKKRKIEKMRNYRSELDEQVKQTKQSEYDNFVNNYDPYALSSGRKVEKHLDN